jgi:hypothetical protein
VQHSGPDSTTSGLVVFERGEAVAGMGGEVVGDNDVFTADVNRAAREGRSTSPDHGARLGPLAQQFATLTYSLLDADTPVDPLSAPCVRFQLLDANYSARHSSDRNNPDQPAGHMQIDGTHDQKSDQQGNERESNMANVGVHPINSLSLVRSQCPPDTKQHICP